MLVARLHYSIRVFEGRANLLYLVMAFDQSLFAVDVLAGVQRIEQRLRMEMERRGNEDDIDVRIVQDMPVVFYRLLLRPDNGLRLIQLERQDVADGPDIKTRQLVRQSQQSYSPSPKRSRALPPGPPKPPQK
jgi:hypothetical protein